MAIPKKKKPAATTIAEWLINNGRTQLWLADHLGISNAQASRICRSLAMPRPTLALRIQELTNNEITVEMMARAAAKGGAENRDALIKHGQRLIARGSAILEEAQTSK